MPITEILLIFLTVSFIFIIFYLIFLKRSGGKPDSSFSQLLNSAINLNEKIISLQKQIEITYQHDQKERNYLTKNLTEMVKTQELLKNETSSLVHVLNGNIKQNGVWGEVILEKILENSGLIDGQNFIREGKGLNTQGENKQNLRPDVVVLLPEGKNFIIDAKFPINSYKKLLSDQMMPEAEDIKLFARTIKDHINQLSSKSYQNLVEGDTPLYTIMFFPIEAVYSFIQIYCDEVIEYAWKKNILLTTPQSLMGILKNSYSIWKIYQSHQNSQEIADKAGALYDKFSGHYDELKKIKDLLNKLSTSFDKSLNQVNYGRGSLVSKVEELRELGAKNKKNIS